MSNDQELAIREAICACFGLQSGSDQALAFVRKAYEEPEVNPRTARSVDVVYWHVATDFGADPASYNTENISTGINKPSSVRFLPFLLTVVCYGPACEANAHAIRSAMYFDGYGQPRFVLRKKSIYPVPNPPPITLLYEPEGSLWRRRADVVIPLRILDTFTSVSARNSIQVTPAVIIHR